MYSGKFQNILRQGGNNPMSNYNNESVKIQEDAEKGYFTIFFFRLDDNLPFLLVWMIIYHRFFWPVIDFCTLRT